jgi:endogenous inhibitor of DNA gyrase (YacG/DUF329 family)
MTSRAEQRPCPACGTAFTWTPAAPRQRFCSTRCRQRWWDRRRRQATTALNRGSIPPPGSAQHRDGPHGAHDPRGDTAHGDGARGHDDAGTLAAIPACPHCRQPVAIVAWLVPPAAASVATPPRHADANP